MGSIQNQQLLIQKETSPGVAAVNAMRSFQSLKLRPGYGEDGGSSFTGTGWRGTSARVLGDEYGAHAVEGIQDFQAIILVLGSLLGTPVTTTPDNVNAPSARQHVFTLAGRGSRTPVTFTVQWGDTSKALQLLYFVFNSLTMGVKRSELTFETSGLSKAPDDTITLASTGITDIPAVPIASNQYNVFADDTYAATGTTKLLACYDASVALGETYGRDAPINSALVSFLQLLENEEVEYNGAMLVAFDSVSSALRANFRNGATKFIRQAVDGPIIGGTIRYKLWIDYAIKIIKTGEFGTAPNSPVVVLPFDYELTPDGSNPLIKVTLVNTLASL
jgi:hypothetical protein